MALEKSLDAADDLKKMVMDQAGKLDAHCKAPILTAHPAPAAELTGIGIDLTPGQKYRLAMMENRGKIIASAAGIILAVLAVIFKTGGI